MRLRRFLLIWGACFKADAATRQTINAKKLRIDSSQCSLWSTTRRAVRVSCPALREWNRIVRTPRRPFRETGRTIRIPGRIIREAFPTIRDFGPVIRNWFRIVRIPFPVVRDLGAPSAT